MNNKDISLEELEKEFQNKLKGTNVPTPNKNWIPEKEKNDFLLPDSQQILVHVFASNSS